MSANDAYDVIMERMEFPGSARFRRILEELMTPEVPFFLKQWGGLKKKKAGRILEGKTWDEMPIT